jgi:acyl-CoA thioester hydrolase
MPEASRFEIRVYYEDTDFSGNVYHAAYLKFFERARTEFLRERGVLHAELAKQGMVFAVRSITVEFERAAHIDDLLAVSTEVAAASGARLTLVQTIRRGDLQLTTARVVVAAIGRDGRPVRLPKLALALGGGLSSGTS